MPEPAAKILVADDDQSLVRTLTWILKENGYDVVTAPGGEGLLGKLEDERPNLLLLDIMMPKVDGLQLLARMKADDRFRDVPVLMISSMPPEEATVKSLGLGAADFISKPFRVRELLARVKAHIRSAQELARARDEAQSRAAIDRKSTRLNSSHSQISYAVFCLKKKEDIVMSGLHYANLPLLGGRPFDCRLHIDHAGRCSSIRHHHQHSADGARRTVSRGIRRSI